MKIEQAKVTDLILSENNVRIHTELQIKEFQRSLNMFGQTRPIVVDEKNHVLIGKGLVMALQANKTQEADIYRIIGLSESQKKKLMLSDNKIFHLGMDDFEGMDKLLKQLVNDLDIPGFDEETLQAISFSAEEVTEKLSEYGTLDEERIQEIRENGKRKEEAIKKARQQQVQEKIEPEEFLPFEVPQEHSQPVSQGELYETAGETKRFVICPKCGEKICL